MPYVPIYHFLLALKAPPFYSPQANQQRRQQRAVPPQQGSFRVAAGKPLHFVQRHDLDGMTLTCRECGAKLWSGERGGAPLNACAFSHSCKNGKVLVAALEPPPEPLGRLLRR